MSNLKSLVNAEFEGIVLGAALNSKTERSVVLSRMQADYFSVGNHALIFRCIKTLVEEGSETDSSLVANMAVKINPNSNRAQIAVEVCSLGMLGYHLSDIDAHIDELIDLWQRRQMEQIGLDFIKSLRVPTHSAVDSWSQMQSDCQRLVVTNATKRSLFADEGIKRVTEKFYESYQKHLSGETVVNGLPTGIPSLDKKLMSLKKGNLVIIGGRPSMGKTGFALNIARNIAVDQSVPVVFYSMEMSEDEICGRLLSMQAGVDSRIIQTGKATETDVSRIRQVPSWYGERLKIDTTTRMTLTQFRNSVLATNAEMMEKLNQPLGCVFVDYLQLLADIPEDGRGQNTNERISATTRMLKLLAAELEIPVILLSQLNRDVEKRQGTFKPQMSDLRSSGSIEQDANVVMFVFREGHYVTTVPKDRLSIIISKNRDGEAGVTVNVQYHLTTQLICDI